MNETWAQRRSPSSIVVAFEGPRAEGGHGSPQSMTAPTSNYGLMSNGRFWQQGPDSRDTGQTGWVMGPFRRQKAGHLGGRVGGGFGDIRI